jgi:pyruvate,water dikinase
MGAMKAAAPVIALDHPAALDVARVGRKAATLAAARAAGLPVGPGVVLTTDWSTDDRATALQVWRITSLDGARPLAVRPSAAGAERCGSGVTDPATVVHDADGALEAIAALRRDDPTRPVLLQPHLPSSWHGVLFADDAGGWRARPVVVVRGAASDVEWIAELDHAGRVRNVLSSEDAKDVKHDGGPPADVLRVLGRLARLAAKVANVFGGPHDLEWRSDADGRLQLLRVRPIVRLHAAPSPRATAPVRRLVDTAA